jgi:hypothetical protein
MNALPPEGLTKTYNHVHQPSCEYTGIKMLRSLHRCLDQAVLLAYGWDDLHLEYTWVDSHSGHVFDLHQRHTKKYMKKNRVRWTFTPNLSDQILHRLLELNQKRSRAHTLK